MEKDDALNTLAKVFHNGEEMEGEDGAVMVVDLALWNEGCDAIEALIGGGGGDAARVEAMNMQEESEKRFKKVGSGGTATCRNDGRCQYAIDHGAEGLGYCPKGKCVMAHNVELSGSTASSASPVPSPC